MRQTYSVPSTFIPTSHMAPKEKYNVVLKRIFRRLEIDLQYSRENLLFCVIRF